jgi:hypothetical protein
VSSNPGIAVKPSSSEEAPASPDPTAAVNQKDPAIKRWVALCAQAAVEQDPKKLLDLVREINRLLEARKKRLSTDAEGQT